MANAASTGVLHGNAITLDAPVPPLEGQRVHMLIELADNDVELAPEQQVEAWRQWTTVGQQGSIEDEGEPEFP